MEHVQVHVAQPNRGPGSLDKFLIGVFGFLQIIYCSMSVAVVLLWESKEMGMEEVTPIALYFVAGIALLVNIGILKIFLDLMIHILVTPKGKEVLSLGAASYLVFFVIIDFLQMFFFFTVTSPYISQNEHGVFLNVFCIVMY